MHFISLAPHCTQAQFLPSPPLLFTKRGVLIFKTDCVTHLSEFHLPLFDFISPDKMAAASPRIRARRIFGDTYPDPPEVHGLSDQLVVLGYLLLRGKLHKAFTDLSTQPGSTVPQIT